MASSSNILIDARNISKRFGITQALDNVSVAFFKGEVHALMGENGAGKSTLGKTIAGLHKPDTGSITIDGVPLIPGNIDHAFELGVRLVHQELAQCPNLSVAENLCLHDMPTSALGLIDRRAMNERAARLVHVLDPSIDVQAPLGELSPGRRQICQIASALDTADARGGGGPRCIVLDEPTSSLSVAEADRLLEITRSLANKGLTMIYVSHRMGEIFQVCDRVTVLRDGKFVATNVVKEIDEPTLVEQMIGRRLQTAGTGEFTKRSAPGTATPESAHSPEEGGIKAMAADQGHHHLGGVVLEVRGVSSPKKLSNVSLNVRAGEVVGIGGLVGCGRSELLNAIFGLDPASDGNVTVAGQLVDRSSPRDCIDKGVGYVPEDRRNQGLFFQMGIDENILMPFMSRLARMLGIRNGGAERSLVSKRIVDFQVKTAGPKAVPGSLSGGNQQKLLIARWMSDTTRVLLLDEPTRGIDVGTKAEVYKLVRKAADRGAAVLLVSSEMPELLALSDRVLVMCAGRITGELTGEAMTQANILRLATADDARKGGVAA
ncbi:MAG: sugar ABC transporter ATP-binding protein [Planctomycetes bacterium]|nr:sugar ABC transporter ATP-binding protein [Planctomycetota bacterium]